MTASHKPLSVAAGIPFTRSACVEHLRAAVDSLLSQSRPVDELHLIQDGPVGAELSECVKGYLSHDRRIRHLPIAENRGLAHALNVSILAAQTDCYARMDADDVCHEDRIARQMEFLERRADVDIVGTWAVEFRDDPHEPNAVVKKLPLEHEQLRPFFHYRDPFVHPSVIFRRPVFARIGLYDVRFRVNQDTELWARALRHGVRLANLPQPLLYFRCTNVVGKRSRLSNVLLQIRARYRLNTLSPRLNAMKAASLGFRLMPRNLQEWAYRELR